MGRQDRLRMNWEALWRRPVLRFVVRVSGWRMWLTYRPLLRTVVEELRGGRILDLGCGIGRTARILARILSARSIVLFDESSLALRIAQKSLEPLGIEVIPEQGDLLCTQFAPSFDLVHSEGLLGHFEDRNRKAALARHIEACRPGGYVLILVPMRGLRYWMTRAVLRPIGQWVWKEIPLTRRELLAGLREHGLEVVATHHSPVLHEAGVLARKPCPSIRTLDGRS